MCVGRGREQLENTARDHNDAEVAAALGLSMSQWEVRIQKGGVCMLSAAGLRMACVIRRMRMEVAGPRASAHGWPRTAGLEAYLACKAHLVLGFALMFRGSLAGDADAGRQYARSRAHQTGGLQRPECCQIGAAQKIYSAINSVLQNDGCAQRGAVSYEWTRECCAQESGANAFLLMLRNVTMEL